MMQGMKDKLTAFLAASIKRETKVIRERNARRTDGNPEAASLHQELSSRHREASKKTR